jgi:hypothetical protein
MKTLNFYILSIIFIFVFIQNTSAQSFWEWSDPAPLTDSLSNNTNPNLCRIGWGSSNHEMYMAWGKSSDTNSTTIYLDNISDNEPAIAILSDPDIHYTNPLILSAIKYPPNDSLFFLFYETDQYGSKDIYYIIYMVDGSFSQPVAFADSEYDDIELDVGGSGFFKDDKYIRDHLVWNSDGNIYTASLIFESNQFFFSDAILIDSLFCSKPCFSNMGWDAYYLKKDLSDETHVYKAHKEADSTWSIELVYNKGDSRNIKTDKFFSDYTIWSTYIDTSWKLILYPAFPYYIFDIVKDTPFDPTIMGNAIIVEKGGPYEYLHISFPYPDSLTDEVFMNPDPYGTYFENFSNSNTENRNTEFFRGENLNSSCFYIYLVWESKQNNHWQVWSSRKVLCIGAIDEEGISNSILNIYPNPFFNETTIEFSLNTSSDVVVEIYNSQGRHISTLTNQAFDPGTHQLRWDGEGLAAGVYIIKMKVGDRIYTEKLVKNL